MTRSRRPSPASALPPHGSLTRGPRLARSLLWRAWPGELRDEILRDLDEEFGQFIASGGPGRRQAYWYWSQVVRSLPAALVARRRFRSQHSREASMIGQATTQQILQDGRWYVTGFLDIGIDE